MRNETDLMDVEIHDAEVRERYCNLPTGARYCGRVPSLQLFICSQRRRQNRFRSGPLSEAVEKCEHTKADRQQHSIESSRHDSDFFRVGQSTRHAFFVEKVRLAQSMFNGSLPSIDTA